MAKKQKTEIQINALNDDVLIDLSSIDNTLSDRAKRFVFWFTYPGSECFQHKTRSALKSGYAKKNAVSSGYKLCQNPTIKKEIQRLSKLYVTEKIENLFNRYIESLENRAFYDIADFYNGDQPKGLDEIANNKRIALDGVDFKGNKAERKILMFGDRKTALKEIRELHKELHPGTLSDEADQEETIRFINEYARSEIIATHRKAKDDMSKMAGLMKSPKREHIITEL